MEVIFLEACKQEKQRIKDFKAMLQVRIILKQILSLGRSNLIF